jgi:site-specific DNA-methyltransferase (adenine-specific)
MMDISKYENQFICADCLDVMDEIPEKLFDLALTDPPYGLGDRLSNGGGKLKNSPFRVLYKESKWNDILPEKQIFNKIFQASKNQIIWGGNYFELPPSRCMIAWDRVQAMPTLSAWELGWTSFDKPSKMFSCSSMDLNRFHPTQKPVALFVWCLLNYSKPGDLIIDPFCGSGTTAIACHKTGRRFLCIDKDEEYIKMAKQRYSDLLLQTDLFDQKVEKTGQLELF